MSLPWWCWPLTWDEFDYFGNSLDRLKSLRQALSEYLHTPLHLYYSSLLFTTIHLFQWTMMDEWWLWAVIRDPPTGSKWFNLLCGCLSVSVSVCHPQPLSSSTSRAVSVSWDNSLMDRQADGSDTSDMSGIRHNNVDGNQWRQWQQGCERLEESEWKGNQRAVAYQSSGLRGRDVAYR